MLENIFRFFLAFSNETIIIPLIIIGYIWLDHDIFYHAICLLLTSILLNVALKSTFKIPLSPTLGKEGFAFPSGHMQSAVVLYGWLFKSTNRLIIKISIIAILVGIWLGLLYFGYHNSFDILGAIFFGLLFILSYSRLLISFKPSTLSVTTLFFSTILVIYISVFSNMKEHSWMAYYALIGIIMSEWQIKKEIILLNNINKLLATVFFCLTFVLINKIFTNFTLPPFIYQLKWLFISYFIPFYPYFFRYNKAKKQVLAKIDNNQI